HHSAVSATWHGLLTRRCGPGTHWCRAGGWSDRIPPVRASDLGTHTHGSHLCNWCSEPVDAGSRAGTVVVADRGCGPCWCCAGLSHAASGHSGLGQVGDEELRDDQRGLHRTDDVCRCLCPCGRTRFSRSAGRISCYGNCDGNTAYWCCRADNSIMMSGSRVLSSTVLPAEVVLDR